MPSRSNFTREVPKAPKGRKLSSNIVKDVRGYNSTDPYTILKDSTSPYLRNARMYKSDDTRQVAISTRTGVDEFSIPVGETQDDSETSTTGASTVTVDNVNGIDQAFTTASAGVLTRVDIGMDSTTASGPLLVKIYSDNSGDPGTLLACSSIKSSDVTTGYVEVRFVEAPTLASATTYHIVLLSQEEGDNYVIATTTNSTDAQTTLDAGDTWTAASYSINFKQYYATAGGVKGGIRFSPSSGTKVTFFGHGNNIYSVNDGTGAVTSQVGSLNASATKVRFAQYDDAVFAVNGYNNLHRSTGSTFSDVSGTSTTTVFNNIISFENRLFGVKASEPTRIEWCNLADYTTWDSVDFAYIPSPKSSDPITALMGFQDDLVILTRDSKFRLVGDYLENYSLEEAYGNMGAVSQEAVCKDENYLYFIGQDKHVYRWNGNDDQQISRPIEADLDDIADVDDVALTYHDDRLYYWFRTSGGTDWDGCFVYEIRFNEWFYDTNRNINGVIKYTQENDVKFMSSNSGTLFSDSDNWSDLGKPIEFEYHTNYFDFGSPDNYKQTRRMYLHFRIPTWRGVTYVGTDLDYRNNPEFEEVRVEPTISGTLVGSFSLGDGSVLGPSEQYFRHRINSPGQGTVFQLRIKKTGVDTPVYLIAHSQYYRNRRPA